MRYFQRQFDTSWQQVLKCAMLAIVLLAAEALAFGHPLDIDGHANDDPCKICLSIAGLAAGAVGKAAAPMVAAPGPTLVVATFHPTGRAAVAAYFARGPPHAS